MKKLSKKLIVLIAATCICVNSTGCSAIEHKEVIYDSDPVDAANISEGVYILTKDGEFYQANTSGQTFTNATDTSNPSRLVVSHYDNKFIPTLYADDLLVYFSPNSIPEYVGVERFEDIGYAPGMYSISQGSNGSLYLRSENMITGSSAGNSLINYLGSGVATVVSINGEEPKTNILTNSGTITGYEKGSVIKLGLMKGTYYSEADIEVDLHVYSSVATDCISSYSTTKNGYIVLNLPDSITQGYVSINNQGLMYISKENRPKKEQE